MTHVRYLADDALEGREVGTPGAHCAGDYIADVFEGLGLEPAGADGSWFQVWDVRLGTRLAGENRLDVGGGIGDWVLERDWTPLGFSASGAFSGRLSGVPSAHGGDAANHSLEGRFLVLDEVVDVHRTASEVARMGGAGLIAVLPAGHPLPTPDRERRSSLDVPVIAVTADRGASLHTAADAGEEVGLTVALAPLMAPARNVAALLRGRSSESAVIVGAHYDHLGLGGEGSLSPNDYGVIHNGADDNASGTGALLEVARELASGPVPDRSVLFLAFTGEERGLWGSAQYVAEPLLPLEHTQAMLNMDMVGRVQERRLTVFGVGTADEWPELLDEANPGDLQLQFVEDGYGSSDHSSFYAKGIPVLHFFSGTHPEYHRVADDWDLINEEGLAHVVRLVTQVTRELVGDSRLALTPIEGAGNPHGAPGAESGDGETVRTGFNVRLGTIPDYSQTEGGMKITGVRDGSPAAKAGLQGGDVIVRMGDRDIEDVYGYMYALQEHQPGDVVDVVVLREGQRITISVTLEGNEG
ncbi:MAG: M28 family peptidase [Gemmatimonadetes bacterium]|nr:M28 family peptidase [Gemmatimonadota bacterium]